MAKFKAAAVFSSNMVLQREKNVRVFGTGKNGESVIVSICTNKAVTEVVDEKWCVTLPAMKAGGPYEMKISNGEETIVFGNVMIGEVWLAGGQSNMELELQNCMGGKDFLAHRHSHVNSPFPSECYPPSAAIISWLFLPSQSPC